MKNKLHHLFYKGNSWKVKMPLIDGKQQEINTHYGKEDVSLAIAERDRLLLPLRIKERASAIAVVESMVKENASQASKALQALNRLKIKDAWEKFPYTESTGKGLKKGVRKLTAKGVATAFIQWRQFVLWAEKTGLVYMDETTPERAIAYARYLIDEKHLANSTHNKQVNTAGVMFRNSTGRNPFESVQRRESNCQSRRYLAPEEIKKVWEVLNARIQEKEITIESKSRRKLKFSFLRPIEAEETARRIEDKHLFALLLYTGMRLGDCVTLTGEHFWGGMIHRTTAKDAKNIGFPVIKPLKETLGTIPKTGFILPLLASDYNGGKSQSVVSNRICRVFDACGFIRLRKRPGGKNKVSVVGGHSMRHTFVQICRDKGIPIDDVRRWLGHTSSIVTAIYNQNPASAMARIAEVIGEF